MECSFLQALVLVYTVDVPNENYRAKPSTEAATTRHAAFLPRNHGLGSLSTSIFATTAWSHRQHTFIYLTVRPIQTISSMFTRHSNVQITRVPYYQSLASFVTSSLPYRKDLGADTQSLTELPGSEHWPIFHVRNISKPITSRLPSSRLAFVKPRQCIHLQCCQC
ncbi:hypothetical protein BDN67DRAFT_571630 [Paxillus ammoniavirescens]|nr:hypothetical protein BDN67DRAFT_571630 [Paxillus ammoniavirescens]